MTALIVRVDATHDHGLAHAIRSSRLLDALPQRPEIHVLGQGEALKQLFPKDRVHTLTGDVGKYLKALNSAVNAQAILIDQPVHDRQLWAALDTLPALTRILIDDFGSDAPADLVLNGTVIEAYHRYPNLRPNGEALCGGQYALIAHDFAQARSEDAKTGPIVAICGGGDRATAWATALAEHGPGLSDHPFLLIVGASYPDFDGLKQLAVLNGGVAKQNLPAHQLCAHLSRARAVICTGGMIVYEALATGAPVLAFPQIDNLQTEIAWFEDQGALINLGFEAGEDIQALKNKLSEILNDPTRAQTLMQAGPELVDGLGMQRAASAVLARLNPDGTNP